MLVYAAITRNIARKMHRLDEIIAQKKIGAAEHL